MAGEPEQTATMLGLHTDAKGLGEWIGGCARDYHNVFARAAQIQAFMATHPPEALQKPALVGGYGLSDIDVNDLVGAANLMNEIRLWAYGLPQAQPDNYNKMTIPERLFDIP